MMPSTRLKVSAVGPLDYAETVRFWLTQRSPWRQTPIVMEPHRRGQFIDWVPADPASIPAYAEIAVEFEGSTALIPGQWHYGVRTQIKDGLLWVYPWRSR